jgi:hypothetical protein
MEKYRTYLVRGDGRIAGFDKISCHNDAEAIKKVSQFAGGRNVEVWTGPRLVTAVAGRKTAAAGRMAGRA